MARVVSTMPPPQLTLTSVTLELTGREAATLTRLLGSYVSGNLSTAAIWHCLKDLNLPEPERMKGFVEQVL